MKLIGLAIVLALIGTTMPASAQAAITRYQVEITRQPLDGALKDFAKQTGLQVARFTDTAGSAPMVGPLNGQLTVDEALGQLLAGSGFTYKVVNEKTVAVVNTENLPPGSTDLPDLPKPTADISHAGSSGRLESIHIAQVEAAQSDQGQAIPAKSNNRNDQKPGEKPDSTKFEEVVVTGTHIRGVHPSSSPLSIYTREDIERTGAATTEQFLRTLPQNLSSMDPTANAVPQQDGIQAQGNAFQGGGINLHGLGFNTTLVLLNGHRVAPAGSNGSFSDVTLIPVSAIERIEILSSGASAIYGTEAVAGVVNIILRNTFEGAEFSAQYGGSTEGGGEEYGGSFALGHAWDAGNVMGVIDYHDQSGLRASERDFVNPSAGVREIMPSGTRKSAFVTARQRVLPRLQLSSDLFYSDREYSNDSVLFGGIVVNHIDGDVGQRGIAPSALIDLNDNWRVNIAGNYSRLKQEVGALSSFFGGPPSTSHRARKTQVSSLDIIANGNLLTLPGGEMGAAVGVSGKSEKVEDSAFIVDALGNTTVNVDTDLERDSFALFGELQLPIIGQDNAKRFAKRLELSVAGRYDKYNGTGGGSKTTPQVGLAWSPANGVNVRGTYGKSFRAPVLEQLNGTPVYFNFSIPNPSGTDTIVDATPFNPDLQPETATAYTFGFDLDRDLVPNTSISATYFHIKFKDRIGQPIIQGGLFNLYNELDQLGSFVRLNPSQEEIDFYFDSGFLEDFGSGRDNVGAIFDSRPKNLTESISEGIDLSARYDAKTRWGNSGFFVNGTRLFTLEHRLLPTTPPADRLGTIWNPPDWKLRGGVDWSLGNFSASVAVNYISHFDNPQVTPAQRVASWTTGDLQLSYRFEKLLASLSVINFTDKDPPFVATPPIFADVGYDPVNASPLGRFISLRLTYQR